jgi:hypothetical protein
MDETELRAALVDHVTVHKDRKYRVTLIRTRTDPPWKADADAVDLDFTATATDPEGDPFPFQLHVSRRTQDDRPYFLRAIDGTIIAILDGRLAPGTRELL